MIPMPVLPVNGLADQAPLAVDRLVDASPDDTVTLVPLVDVLAAIRIHVSAEILMVHVAGGASVALHVREVLARGDIHLRLDRARSSVQLVTTADRTELPAGPVVAVRAMSFASFISGRW
jgi:hypothetical protein